MFFVSARLSFFLSRLGFAALCHLDTLRFNFTEAGLKSSSHFSSLIFFLSIETMFASCRVQTLDTRTHVPAESELGFCERVGFACSEAKELCHLAYVRSNIAVFIEKRCCY